jgi:predicted ATPase
LIERRKQLHEDVGRAIEELYAASLEDHFADLAHHYSRSANRAKAVKYLSLAGTQAMARGALHPAVRTLESALALLKLFPEDQSRDQMELQILTSLGTAYIAVRGYAAPQVGPTFHRARQLCERIGGPQERFAAVWGNFAWRIVRGEMDLSLELAHEAIDRAKQLDDPGVWMEAMFLMGVTLYYRGDFVGARQQYETALARYDDDPERTRRWALRVGEHAGVTHRCYLALTLWHLGLADQALKMNREMLALARSINHPFSLAYALHHTSWLFQYMRLPAEALAVSREQIRFAADQGFPLFRATGLIYEGGSSLLRGQAAQSLPGLLEGLNTYRATGAALALPYYLGLLGSALIDSSPARDAEAALDKALSVAEESRDLCHEAELHRLKGELAARYDRRDVAEANFHRSIEIAQKQQSKAFELRANTSLARLYKRTNRHRDGRERLDAILSSFTEGFATPDLEDGRALVVQLDST